MTLVDSSIWVDHFRGVQPKLEELLDNGEVLMHPMVLGELSCGGIPSRAQTLQYLGNLPSVSQAPDDIVLQMIEQHKLWGKGISWGDAHILVAAIRESIVLWTRDAALAKLAASLVRVN